jgi:hypothetical protein
VRHWFSTLTLCLPLFACDPAKLATPPASSLAPNASPKAHEQTPSALLPERELKLPVVRGASRERCPDELLPRGAEADLAVRAEDARSERRELLPLDLSTALRAEPSERSASPRYLAELLIDDYSAPRLFRRLNAPRSEWAAGRLSARLVVHDLGAQRVLCQVPLSVRGNADGAPIRRRLREATRQSLERKLYGRVRDAMDTALGSISSVLRLARSVGTEVSSQGS